MQISLTNHCKNQIAAKGINLADVLAVAAHPDIEYPSLRHPGQVKRTGRGLCLAVDPTREQVITVFVDQEYTPLRPDQIAAGVVINHHP